MSRFSWLERPRLLAVLAFAFALVPAWLAWITYRDAKQKDDRVYQTTAQVLGEQLQRSFEEHTYFPIECRKHSLNLAATDLAAGKMMLPLDWKKRLPHLLGLAYAEHQDPKIIVRWKSEERVPLPPLGDDVASIRGVTEALSEAAPPQSFQTRGLFVGTARMMILLALPGSKPTDAPRGFILAWIDVASMCNDASLPLIRDQVLRAELLPAGTIAPAASYRRTIKDGTAQWEAAITRGLKFSDQYGAPTPWLTLLAVALSALPLLVLASLAARSAKLGAALAAQQEILRQQRFFTQSVSHEFRTPLGIILSGADLLDEYAAHLEPGRRREVLAEIKDNTRQMSTMVEQVLTLGRMDANRMTMHPKPVNVAALCQEIAHKVAPRDANAVTVTAPEGEVMLDPALLGSVLVNLLSNAIKYSPPGKPVHVDAAVESGHLVIKVRDEGIGIPADEIARVCDPFHRCANAGDAPGSGLGLAIAQHAVALHGGSMQFQSIQNQGTTVTVTLPISPLS